MIVALTVIVIASILIALLRHVASRLIYPAPPASQPWGALVLQRPDVTLRSWITHPDVQDAWIVFGGNALAFPPVAEAWRDCTGRALYLMPYRVTRVRLATQARRLSSLMVSPLCNWHKRHTATLASSVSVWERAWQHRWPRKCAPTSFYSSHLTIVSISLRMIIFRICLPDG